MRKHIASLHYLTQDLDNRSHEEQVRIACAAGIKWVQLRVKNQPPNEWRRIAEAVKKITDQFHVTLIINDSVEIAKAVGADGVHLGQQDTSPVEARRILGDARIIGFSVHSKEELMAAEIFDVDYFGVGPFSFTSTKERLDAVLGPEGFSEIVLAAKSNLISKPLIAIGGIQLRNVDDLLRAGADGIAISSAINGSVDPAARMREFLRQLKISNLKLFLPSVSQRENIPR